MSQIRNSDRQKHTAVKAATIENLVASLQETEQALRANIRVEEETTCFRHHTDPCYSALARAMRERADNIRMTIATLEATREVA